MSLKQQTTTMISLIYTCTLKVWKDHKMSKNGFNFCKRRKKKRTEKTKKGPLNKLQSSIPMGYEGVSHEK